MIPCRGYYDFIAEGIMISYAEGIMISVSSNAVKETFFYDFSQKFERQ